MRTQFIVCWLICIIACTLVMADDTPVDLSALPNGTGKDSAIDYLIKASPKEMNGFRFAEVNAAFTVVEKIRKIALDCHKDTKCTPVNRAKSEIAYR